MHNLCQNYGAELENALCSSGTCPLLLQIDDEPRHEKGHMPCRSTAVAWTIFQSQKPCPNGVALLLPLSTTNRPLPPRPPPPEPEKKEERNKQARRKKKPATAPLPNPAAQDRRRQRQPARQPVLLMLLLLLLLLQLQLVLVLVLVLLLLLPDGETARPALRPA